MSSNYFLNYCPSCGTKIIHEAKFCSECGYQLEKLRQLLNECQNQERDNQKNENNNIYTKQTYNNEDYSDKHQNNSNQHLTEEEGTFEKEQVFQDENPQNNQINDIELIRPNYNENNHINQDHIKYEKDMERETIQIQVDDDSNDFDIIRPNSQKEEKKRPKDFSILNLNDKNQGK